MKDKIIPLLEGKTIEKVEVIGYQAPNDTLILHFTDKTRIKIVSDPNCCFDGFSFYVPKTKTVVIEEYEEIKE